MLNCDIPFDLGFEIQVSYFRVQIISYGLESLALTGHVGPENHRVWHTELCNLCFDVSCSGSTKTAMTTTTAMAMMKVPVQDVLGRFREGGVG